MSGASRNAMRRLMAGVGAALLVAACSTSPARITEETLEQRLAAATTAEDHASLAGYFRDQASKAEEKAAARRAARRHYAHTPAGTYYPIGMAPAMLEHYDRLIAGYEQEARESSALADSHQRLADLHAPKSGAH